VPHYAWSIPPSDLEARIFEVLSEACLRVDDPIAALNAIEQACKIAPRQHRGVMRATILCDHFPDRQEEAFDAACKHAEHGGYEVITALPAYAKYVARRQAKSKSGKGWRWDGKKPANPAEVRKAEEQLGAELPKDYRNFLAKYGAVQLAVRLPQESGELCFHAPAELAKQRQSLFDFIVRTEKDATKASAYFREQHGVSLHDLVPVAEPTQESRCVVIHLEKGDRFGWCFQWDHDVAWELEHATPSFDAALKAFTDGIERRDRGILSFLGIHTD
jgi:hypothetical protein